MFYILFRARVFLLTLFVVFFVFFFSFFYTDNQAFASETNGTIDTTFENAWGENIGWINFGCAGCDVAITDAGLTGNAWSSQYGWISLDTTTSGVTNNGEGVLGGFAWSSNLGWINFTGVTINSSGEFLGYATLESDSSQINFNCVNGGSCAAADFKVKTDWRPASSRSSGSSGGGSSGSIPNPPILPPAILPPVVPPTIPPVTPPPSTPQSPVVNILNYLLSFFKPTQTTPSVAEEIPKIAPFALGARWNLLPVRAIREFVFAPLPYEVRTLAAKFPELEQTLKDVGIDRLSDLEKLSGVTLNIKGLTELEKTIQNIGVGQLNEIDKLKGVPLSVPGISDPGGKITGGIGTGRIALISGLPVSNFPLIAKQNLPTEFVFARAAGELVDLNVAISVGEKGQVAQTINSLPGKTLKLVVKPISKARSVTGYFVFKSATPKITQDDSAIKIARSSLSASALFSMNDLVEKNPEPIFVENKLVLSTFEYTDPDGDGIYTADVVSPIVPGEYEVITVIDYIDPVLGVRQMRMITVIDPEGYVFEKNGDKETRIPSAIVSIYHLNTATKKYELWNAEDYHQENPQITDVRGTYSFLVPEGAYYFQVEAPGYEAYEGKVFSVTEGSGVHQNIELKSSRSFFSDFDWKTALLIVVLLLLVYNLFRDSLRNELSKFLSKKDGK